MNEREAKRLSLELMEIAGCQFTIATRANGGD